MPGPAAAVGSRRFEAALLTVVAVFGVLYALQTIDSLVADWPGLSRGLRIPIVVLEVASIMTGASGALLRSRARALFVVAFLLHLAALAIWPFAIVAPVPADEQPWLVGVWGAQAAYVSAASRRWAVPIAAGAFVAVDVTVVLVVAGGQSVSDAVQGGVFCLTISGILTAVISGVRRAVAAADAAQQAALARYGESRIDEAVESERVRTDALVHDAVLTTFLSAASAADPAAEALVVRMAERALRVTSAATLARDDGMRIRFPDALERSRLEFTAVAKHFSDLRLDAAADVYLPESVAQAMVEAMLEAMASSVQHSAGAVRRSVVTTVGAGDGVRIEVRDDGSAVEGSPREPCEGLPASIVDRMRDAGGLAELHPGGGAGAGTSIVLTYPAVAPVDDRALVPV